MVVLAVLAEMSEAQEAQEVQEEAVEVMVGGQQGFLVEQEIKEVMEL